MIHWLQLELILIERNSLAKGMILPNRLSSEEATTKEYKIGNLGYWNASPDLTIFYDDIYEQTIVEIILLNTVRLRHEDELYTKIGTFFVRLKE